MHCQNDLCKELHDFQKQLKFDEKVQTINAECLKSAILHAHKVHQDKLSVARVFYIKNITVIGPLDLSNYFSNHYDSLIGMQFEDCVFQDWIYLKNSCITSIKFRMCKLVGINGSGCTIDNEFELKSVESAEDGKGCESGMAAYIGSYSSHLIADVQQLQESNEEGCNVDTSSYITSWSNHGLCHVIFNGAKIHGKVLFDGSKFCAPNMRENVDTSNERKVYAIELNSAQIGGNLHILERCIIIGGISLSGANIGGDLFILGARVIKGEGAAINGQLLSIDGFIGLRSKIKDGEPPEIFESLGEINLLSARIGSTLDMAGIFLIGCSETKFALILAGAKMDSLKIYPSRQMSSHIRGLVNLYNAEIKNSAELNFGSVRNRRTSNDEDENNFTYTLVELFGATIGKALTLSGEIRGHIRLDEIKAQSIKLGLEETELKIIVPPAPNDALSVKSVKCTGAFHINNIDIKWDSAWYLLKDRLKSKKPIKARSICLSFAKDSELIDFQFESNNRLYLGSILRLDRLFYLLDLSGTPLHESLANYGYTFDSDQQKLDYLRVYCGSIAGGAGQFRIIEPGDWYCGLLDCNCTSLITPLKLEPLKCIDSDKRDDYQYAVSGTIWYGDDLLRCTFAVKKGIPLVEMLNGEKVVENIITMSWPVKPLYFMEEMSYKFSDEWPVPPLLSFEPRGGDLEKNARKSVLKTIDRVNPETHFRPTINLRNSHVAILQDSDGENWPTSARLEMENFNYDALEITTKKEIVEKSKEKKTKTYRNRIKSPIAYRLGELLGLFLVLVLLYFLSVFLWRVITGNFGVQILVLIVLTYLLVKRKKSRSTNFKATPQTWKKRKIWLRLQYHNYFPTREEFNPQPIEQLARVYRHQGQEKEFRQISRLKAKWRYKLKRNPLIWLFSLIFRTGFGYGYSLSRAFLTFVLFWGIGIIGVEFVQTQNLLIERSSNVLVSQHGNVSCQGKISPILYSLDLFLPLVNLGQEENCSLLDSKPYYSSLPDAPDLLPVRPDSILSKYSEIMSWVGRMSNWLENELKGSRIWNDLRTIYKLLGWVVSYLLILTLSRTVRKDTGE